jgi:hypothetical protein
MKYRQVSILLMAAIALMAAACSPMRMGLQQATLEKLLEKQARCDQLRQTGFNTDAEMLECQNNGNALEKSSGEYAAEGARQSDPANKVFWFSLAATAGWRSQRPQGMQGAITYADEGGQICDQSSGIQPGDCAYMYAIPAFVANESVTTAFIDLQSQADNAARGKPVSVMKEVLQELYLALQPDGRTRIEGLAASLLQDGWASLQTSWHQIRKLDGLHPDVICALGKNQKRMVDNLEILHARVKILPLSPENTNWIRSDLCNDWNINPETTADVDLAPMGADFAALDEDGKQRLMHRAMVYTYCTWQYARQHSTLEECPSN